MTYALMNGEAVAMAAQQAVMVKEIFMVKYWLLEGKRQLKIK